VVHPLSIMICPIPTGRVQFECCAAIRGPMIWGRGHGGMRVRSLDIMMAIRIGRRLVGKSMVDRRGRDGVEELSYGGALVSMRVVNGPTHRCQRQQDGRGIGTTGEVKKGGCVWWGVI
jgi:hypothetical protein